LESDLAVKMHELEAEAHFEQLHTEFTGAMSKRLRWLAEGRGDPQAISRGLCRDSIALGCMALILGHSDDEAREHFHAAAEYAGKWLVAPGSTGGPRVYEVRQEASEAGIRVTAIHETPPSHEPRKLSIIDFGYILAATATFGGSDAMAAVGGFPEAGYQNPNVVAGPAAFTHDRAWKAWLRGEEAEARKEGLLFLKQSRETGPRAGMSAFLAMTTGDAKGFRKHLDERLKAYRKQYQRRPNDPEGFVCLDGLALCRLAIDRGIAMADGPYLPVRLLPNYAGGVVH
jgi:hypothetical protein